MSAKTKSAEIERINRKLESEQQQAAQALELLALLPDGIEFELFVVSKLYGKVATLVLERTTRDDLKPLLEQFPPVATSIYKDGCTSIRPDAAVSDAAAEKFSNITSIAPVTFTAKYATIKLQKEFNWVTRLQNKLVEIEVRITDDHELARYTYRRVACSGVYVIENETFASDLLAGGYAQQIRWGNGGPEYTHDRTIYWLVGDDPFGIGEVEA